MSIDTFIGHFAEALETGAGALTPQTVFKDLDNWDSLAALSVIAMIDEHYGASIGGADLEKARSLQDLHELVAQRRA
ncbi:acyl carrier protein [Massilia forsythiae]|uniref:Acyl carrier protein n=1 Tax=Massilia forsythiae TaxID=2728020 RepID=A0A7Z2VT64_9BURK|nr:acyl carrier protein [Massilia forsythiae]QJD99017.1 acyl carrier protein [Massilia forsythiae]